MNQRPWPLYTLSMICLIAAISIPLQAMWIYQIDFSFALKMLTVSNWLVFGLLLANSVIIPSGSRLMIVSIPLCLVTVALNNNFVGSYSQDFNLYQTHLATGAFFMASSLMLHPRVLYYMKFPNRRAWRTAPRYQRDVDLRIFPDCSDIFDATAFDISSTGIFIPIEKERLNDIKIGETLRIQLRFDSVFQMTVNAKVVRCNQASGVYPAGAGCQFETFDWKTKSIFSRFLEA